MRNKYIGETVRWETSLEDQDGTALGAETPILRVEDRYGTTVLTGTGTFVSDGTYFLASPIGSGWGTGPCRYWWDVYGANGTARDVNTNELNIIAGTSEPPSYVYESELPSYYGNIEDYFGDNTQDKIVSVYHMINRHLETLNIKAPRLRNADGLHDQSVRDWNAWWAIYFIVQDMEANRVSGDIEEKPWFSKFYDEGDRIYKAIKSKKIVFRNQVSPADSGISRATKTVGSSIGTMHTNWDKSYGRPFSGTDFARDWSVEITGTGTASGLFECGFKYSSDSGETYGTGTTGRGWMGLGNEVYIRFEKGTSSGTTSIFNIGDKWEFNTEPRSKSTGGFKVVKSY